MLTILLILHVRHRLVIVVDVAVVASDVYAVVAVVVDCMCCRLLLLV